MVETRREKKRRMDRERQRRHRARKQQLRRESEDRKRGFTIGSNVPLDIDEGIDWINNVLVIPTGPDAGKPLKLLDWQEEWVRNAYAPETRRAGLSIARKNAKTMLQDALALCHLVGPWNRANWRGLVCADKAEHAALFREQLMEVALASGLQDHLEFLVSPKPGLVRGKGLSELKMLAADKHGTGHASNADAVWIDECGALTENHRQLYNAMFSSIGARNGRLFAIGNQREGPMFRELEMMSGERGVCWRRYSGPSDCDIMDEDAWLAANPGLGIIKTWQYMRDAAEAAKGTPSNISYFRSHELNQNIDPQRIVIVEPEVWRGIEGSEFEIRDEPVVCGFDLGGSKSMSAVVAIGLESGVLMVWAGWGDHLTLLERGRQDGVDNLYLMMRERGELEVYPGQVIAAGQFIWDVFRDLRERGADVLMIGSDRFRKWETTKALLESGYRGRVAWRGIGASKRADGSADIRSFQRLVYRGEIRPKSSLLLENAIRSSTLREDDAGNPALYKGSNANSRIDALQAAVIACGLYDREREAAADAWVIGG